MSPAARKSPTIESVDLTLLIDRFDSLDDRLTAIAEKTESIALMQHQLQIHTSNFSEIDDTIKNIVSEFKTSITRVHNRMDEITQDTIKRIEFSEQKSEVGFKDIGLQISEVKSEANTCSSKCFSKNVDLERQITTSTSAVREEVLKVDGLLKKWLNRGIGLFISVGAFLSIIQAFFGYWIGNIDSDRKQLNQAVQDLRDMSKTSANRIENHAVLLNELVQSNKLLTQKQRDLEDLMLNSRRDK